MKYNPGLLLIKPVLISIITLSLAASPLTALAQSTPLDPGQDPFALTPEKLQLFQGYNPNDPINSLFNGDHMKNNGLFTTPPRQLGGATPDLTAPIIDNEEEVKAGPTFIVITSQYQPTGDLTKDSEITLTVTLKNIGDNIAEDITLSAKLEDNNATLLDTPAPNPPYEEGSQIEDKDVGLIWTKMLQHPNPVPVNITLESQQEATFSWSFKPTKDDTILRWRFEANYGAGQSVLRQWIPIKNPNPTGVLVPGDGPANGIPNSCTSTSNAAPPFPESDSPNQIITAMESRWSFDFRDGSYSWSDAQFKPVLKVWWDTLAAVECTPFLTEINNKNGGGLAIYAHEIGNLWGTYGLHFPGALAINIRNHLGGINNGIPEKVTQNIIHELGHAYNNDRSGSGPPYWTEHNKIYYSAGPISGYGASEITENIADVVGFYVARCAGESFGASGPNPFASGHTEFYNWAKEYIFGGVEFGPPAPATVSC